MYVNGTVEYEAQHAARLRTIELDKCLEYWTENDSL